MVGLDTPATGHWPVDYRRDCDLCSRRPAAAEPFAVPDVRQRGDSLVRRDGSLLLQCAGSRDRAISVFEMARECFSVQEENELRNHLSGNVNRRFFEYWTLKEAFIKAMGMGLSLPLGEFSFQISKDHSIGIEFTREIAEEPAEWQFRLFELVQGYQCALAVKCGAAQKLSIVQMGDYLHYLPAQKAPA